MRYATQRKQAIRSYNRINATELEDHTILDFISQQLKDNAPKIRKCLNSSSDNPHTFISRGKHIRYCDECKESIDREPDYTYKIDPNSFYKDPDLTGFSRIAHQGQSNMVGENW